MHSAKRNYFNSALDSHSSAIFSFSAFHKCLIVYFYLLQKFWSLTESSGSLITDFASKCLNETNVFSQYIRVTFSIADSLNGTETIFHTGIHSTLNHELPPLYLTFLCKFHYNNAKFIGWHYKTDSLILFHLTTMRSSKKALFYLRSLAQTLNGILCVSI